jgi:putative flippase GtrA
MHTLTVRAIILNFIIVLQIFLMLAKDIASTLLLILSFIWNCLVVFRRCVTALNDHITYFSSHFNVNEL